MQALTSYFGEEFCGEIVFVLLPVLLCGLYRLFPVISSPVAR
jgi:hypothetical protein